MRALVYSAYYEPEIASSLYLSTNLYEDLANAGIDIELFVPLPTRGVSDEIRSGYKKKKVEIKCKGNLKIHRVYILKEKKSIFLRALRYLVMNVVFIFKSFSIRPDFIFVQSTPPTQGAMAAIIKKIKGVPLIYNLQDIFPDSLVGAGITKKGSLIYKIGRVIEDFTYKNSNKIIVISENMRTNIVNKGVEDSKVCVIRNWIDNDVVKPIPPKDNYLFERFNISRDTFNVIYAGNLGYAQNIEVILYAAKYLEGYEKIRFYIFGKGNQENEYKKIANAMQLKNLSFFPIQPYKEVSYVYSMGSVSVVPCKKGFGGSAMPSKIWSIMATGTPVLASFDFGTELQSLVEKEGIGLFSEAEDAQTLAKNILTLYKNPAMISVFGKAAREYIELYVNREMATKEYLNQIMESCNANS